MEDRDLKGEKIEEVERMEEEQICRGEQNLRNNLVQPPHSTEGESEAQSLASSPTAFPPEFVLWGWANLTSCHKIKPAGLRLDMKKYFLVPQSGTTFFGRGSKAAVLP